MLSGISETWLGLMPKSLLPEIRITSFLIFRMALNSAIRKSVLQKIIFLSLCKLPNLFNCSKSIIKRNQLLFNIFVIFLKKRCSKVLSSVTISASACIPFLSMILCFGSLFSNRSKPIFAIKTLSLNATSEM
ncbi:hypothetical protein D3C85_1214220 [compost metagenome]